MPELISLAEARRRVLGELEPLAPEEIPLAEAGGRFLADDVASGIDLPPFDSSAMDGYAVAEEAEGELRIVGESRAGAPAEGELRSVGASRAGAPAEGPLASGTAIRISTGARVPPGAAVVPLERAKAADGAVTVERPAPGANVRRAGEDVRTGQTVLRAGTRLGPAELGMLASLGRGSVRCAPRPRVALAVTGDELVEPGRPLPPGGIYGSNGAALAAQAERAGGLARAPVRVPDDPDATREALREALDSADLVCVSGGVSVGPHDHVRGALAELGVEERFWGVALKPGKPTLFGLHGQVPVFGLPGNPVSAMVTFELLARPALRALQGADPAPRRAGALLVAPIERNARREEAVRVRLHESPDGRRAEPTGPQESHRLSSMLGADGLVLVAPGEGEVPAGERVEVELL